MKRFENKVVVITGASSGIGEALVREFFKRGAAVVAAARSKEKLDELAAELSQGYGPTVESDGGRRATDETVEAGAVGEPGGIGAADVTGAAGVADVADQAGANTSVHHRILAVRADVSCEEDCKRLIGEAVGRFGRIDVLICNAGISMRAAFDDVDLQVLKRLMDVNFWGTVHCSKYALPWLLRSRGSIVGVSSVAGLHGLPGRTGYSASKYAMTGFLETLRIENLHKGLHVMVACPGFTATNVRFTALTADGSPQGTTPREEGKMMSAEEVARRIACGIVRRKRLLLMEWEGRATHFIKKFAPAFLDRMFYTVMAREPDSPLSKTH